MLFYQEVSEVIDLDTSLELQQPQVHCTESAVVTNWVATELSRLEST